MFTDFVMECVTHGVINVSPEDTNELDTLLRRTACLDPSGFKKAISRCDVAGRTLPPLYYVHLVLVRERFTSIGSYSKITSALNR